jgi:hypothetical protein
MPFDIVHSSTSIRGFSAAGARADRARNDRESASLLGFKIMNISFGVEIIVGVALVAALAGHETEPIVGPDRTGSHEGCPY